MALFFFETYKCSTSSEVVRGFGKLNKKSRILVEAKIRDNACLFLMVNQISSIALLRLEVNQQV